MISRLIEKQVVKELIPGQVVGIFGARRTGKTYLLKHIEKEIKGKILSVHGENLDVAEELSSQRVKRLSQFTQGFDYLFIDEAQKIPNIGQNLKLIVDTISHLCILVTGSSSFDLKNKIGNPLVGRSRFFHLYPLAQLELKSKESFLETKENLEQRLIYGSYPQVFLAATLKQKIAKLQNIRDAYLLQDILSLDNLKDSQFIFNLLRLIAFQIGHDISYSELASNLNVNKKTVMRYLELLEKTYVLFSLPGFSRNLRKEYTKTPRYYFWDNGIRNAIIANFNHLTYRDDVGQLWENYLISERLKKNSYQTRLANSYFWRTYDQKELDYVEESEGKLFGFEIKWKKDFNKIPKEFLTAYSNAKFSLINNNQYLDFIS